MIRISIDPREPDERAIRDAAEVLERGGVVAYPTDTLYGLAVDPRSDEAVTRLFAIKDRDRESAIALIASDAAQAEQVGAFGPAERRLAARLWPGPITIVVPRAPGMSALLSPRFDTLGVRVPAHAVATALPRAFGSCITATSANLSDRPAAITADEVAAALGDSVDLLLDGGPAPGGPPSTVVAVVGGRPVLFRAGAVAWDRVLESLE